MADHSTVPVSMLWEPHDPQVVLRDRFGFPTPDAAAMWVASVLRDQWGIGVATCERLVLSDSNALAWVIGDGARLIVKWSVASSRFDRLDALAGLVTSLGDRGVPVSAPVPAREGWLQPRLTGGDGGLVSVGVQRVVRGELLDVTDLGQVRATGVAMAGAHLALADEGIDRRLGATEPPPLEDRLDGWLADATPTPVTAGALGALRSMTPGLPEAPTATQLVHGDVRAANVLVDAGRVTALLDFEEARIDLPVVELARSAVLLGTRYHHWAPVDSSVHGALRAGYESVRPLADAEAAWWEPLLLWFTLQYPAWTNDAADAPAWEASAATLASRIQGSQGPVGAQGAQG